MYGKIFDTMYDSTLADDWRALITFQQLIVLCDADGTVDMTPRSISRRTGIPIEHIEAGLKILEEPDPYSRTPDQEGRRIELIDAHRPWGWSIINHSHYKNLQDAQTVREQTRERVKKHREKKTLTNQETCNASSVTVTQCNSVKRHTDTDTDIKTLVPTVLVDASASTCPYQKIVNVYHQHFPIGAKVKQITPKRQKSMKARWKNGASEISFWENYFKHAAKSQFLTGNNNRNWIADFDFFIRPDTATFMQEGKYHK